MRSATAVLVFGILLAATFAGQVRIKNPVPMKHRSSDPCRSQRLPLPPEPTAAGPRP